MSDETNGQVLDGADACDETVSTDDSAILNTDDQDSLLQIRQTGAVTVVGLDAQALRAEDNIGLFRGHVIELIREHDCTEFVFDLAGIPFMPSGALGLIASIRNLDVKVAVLNPEPQVREVFEITQLDTVVELRSDAD